MLQSDAEQIPVLLESQGQSDCDFGPWTKILSAVAPSTCVCKDSPNSSYYNTKYSLNVTLYFPVYLC